MVELTKFENIKKEIFATKEDYLAFRQAWKDYINSGKAKPSYVEYKWNDNALVKRSNLTASQQLLFCILTEKDLSITFKGSKNPSKSGFENAFRDLRFACLSARKIKQQDDDGITEDNLNKWNRQQYIPIRNRIGEFLEPFGKSVDKDLLIKLLEDYFEKVMWITNNRGEINEAA